MILRRNHWKKTYLTTVFLLFFLFSASGVYFVLNPLQFLKSVTIQPTDDILDSIHIDNARSVRIESLIRQIPYKGSYVYTILPEDKYQRTIVEGYGDCSNLSYGLAYYLSKHGYKYLLVHFLNTDKFLKGVGHVALQTPYIINGENFTGIVDVSHGGLLITEEGELVGVREILDGQSSDISIYVLNSSMDNSSKFYSIDSLQKLVIGVMIFEEVEEYFEFITSGYIPLGSEKIEKYVYDGISILFDKYPTIYVARSDYRALFEGHGLIAFLSISMLWTTRISVFMVPFFLIIWSFRFLRTKLF